MLVKFAIKTAIATALVGTIFQGAHLVDHLAYPAMGLVSTMQPGLGSTVKKTWGRLAGSAIGGMIGACVVLTLGTSPIAVGLAFVLAALICELFQVQAAYNQAGVIAALVAAHVMGADNPLYYTFSRILDNWIGIIIGIGVTLLIWPDNPRQKLSSNLIRVLNTIEQLFQSIVERYQSGSDLSPEDSQCVDDLGSSIEKSKSVLSQEIYGIVGSNLVQENWSNLLAVEDRVHRHLSMMLKVLPIRPDELSLRFDQPLTQLANQISHICQDLTETVQSMSAANSKPFRFWVSARQRQPLTKPDIEPAKASLRSITDQLNQMRMDGTAYQYPILEVRQLYRFLHHLRQFVLALEQLTIALVNREKAGTQPRAGLCLSWHPVASNQILHIFKTGFAVCLSLVLLNDWLKLPFNYYAIVAVVVAMQPTVGKSVAAGVQRVIATSIGAVYALLLIHTLGGTPLTLAVGIVLIILTCSYLGFFQGYTAGCILIILTLLSHSNDPNGYIWGRFIETLIGTVIALILSQVLWPNRSSQQLEQGISQTFRQMGSLYSQLVHAYLEGAKLEEGTTQLSQTIKKSLKTHEALQKEAEQEPVYSPMAPKAQRRWNLLLGYEKTLCQNLEALQDAVQAGRGSSLPQELQNAIRASAEATESSFKQLAQAIEPTFGQPKISSALPTFDLIDQVLLNMRATRVGRSYSLDQILSLTAVILAMKDTAENLHQLASDLQQGSVIKRPSVN